MAIIYNAKPDPKYDCWNVFLLKEQAKIPEAIIIAELYTPKELIAFMSVQYPGCQRLNPTDFAEALALRQTHTPELLTLLKDNYTGKDLLHCYVYGSMNRAMDWIRVPDAVLINLPGKAYGDRKPYTYVVVPELLDAEVRDSFELNFVSRPEMQ